MLSIPWAVIRHRPLGLFPDTHVHRGHDTPFWNNNLMATAPDSTKTSLRQRIQARARERWPQLNDIHIRHQGAFAYVAGESHRRHNSAVIPIALQRILHDLGIRYLPGKPRRLRTVSLAERLPNRHTTRSPRLRLRPLPQRPHRLATPDELTDSPTSPAAAVARTVGSGSWASARRTPVSSGWLRRRATSGGGRC